MTTNAAALSDPAALPTLLPGDVTDRSAADETAGTGTEGPTISPEIQAIIDARVTEATKAAQAEAAQKARQIANQAIAPFQSQAAKEKARADRAIKERDDLTTKLRAELPPEEAARLDALLGDQAKDKLAQYEQAERDTETQQQAAAHLAAQANAVHAQRLAHLETLKLDPTDPAVKAAFDQSYDGSRFNGWDESNLFWGTEIARIAAERAAGIKPAAAQPTGAPAAPRQQPDPVQPIAGTPAAGGEIPVDFFGPESDLYDQAFRERNRRGLR